MPYWRLSGFYFFFFASLGALTPYWPLYLQGLGFTPTQIGELMAILLATKIVSPNLWAWIADRSGRGLPMARLAALLALVCFLGLYRAVGFWAVALVMLGFSFFWHAVLPQVETATLNHLQGPESQYGRVRLWGSLGFIVFVLGLGPMVEAFGAAATLPAVAVALLCVWLTTLVIPDPGRPHSPVRASFNGLLTHRTVLALLACCLMMQASHAPYYAFFSIHLSEHGYSKTLIGGLWAFGVLCEIGIFYYMVALQKHLSAKSLLIASLLVSALRWLLVAAYPESLTLMVLAQSLHAITFGVYHAAALQLVRGMFTGHHQNRGVALYGSVSFGIGGALGSYYSGYLWAAAGPAATFGVAAAVAVLGAVAASALAGRASPCGAPRSTEGA